MGKILVIKGANFQANAIDGGQGQLYEMQLEQGGIIVITTSSNFGGNSADTSAQYLLRLRAVNNIELNLGDVVTFYGLKGINGLRDALRIDVVWYSSQERSHANAVGVLSNGVAENYFPLNINGDDSVSFTNVYGHYYFGFTFAGPQKTEETLVANYNPLHYSKNQ